ncbi:nucleotidyltransferase domain-containing protein [Paraglaciecola sp. MB-3u-78]|uniref:type VII toxin-antitoxin system MntA family adenylyltransferase antitoxin n=1 Tax=Paraglaciecola sp. MB-3u-78 TaxID=2058332 RepID=UPI000C33EC9F|nr:nucleotidyltransferase domain-containing protein [Paraglaciecola sp. MB-3u-78]PKG98899.1 nucleotidyltransferase domain-containing protein [Paraglaciecola sp. MB-3u-78]
MAVRSQEKLINDIRSLVLEQSQSIKLIYLFGSHANNQSDSQSDIDIAILGANKFDPVARWQWQNELTIALKNDVDLVDLLSASTVMQNQVIHHGMCIYDAANYAALFEMQVMSMYQHLNDERADILKQHMSLANE